MSELDDLPSAGDQVMTPRGEGRVRSVEIGLAGVVVAVDLASGDVVDFRSDEVLPVAVLEAVDLGNVGGVEEYLARPSVEQQLANVEALLAMETSARPQPAAGGRTRGARTIACACQCGQEGGCHRLSSAPTVHHMTVTNCPCEREGCECADG